MDLKPISGYSPTTPAAMLENCFKSSSSIAVKKNKVQECLKAIFNKRECFSLPKPSESNSSESFELTSACSFPQACEKLLQALKLSVKPKQILGKTINGNMLLGLALEYVQVLSSTQSSISSLGSSLKSIQIEFPISSLLTTIDKVAAEETHSL
jgi:hypothetical protein